jgi:excisionase family DNA binding protein
VSVSTIRRLIEQGGLTAVRVGHRVLVRASQVASLVAGQSDVDGR